MESRIHRPSPSMVVALTALVFAMGGSGYAATQLAGHGHTATAAKKKKVLRGPAGPQGSPGAAGAPGAPGGPGPTGPTVFFGHIDFLSNTAVVYATPTGYSQADGTEATRAAIAPNIPLKMTNFTVKISNAPGTGAERLFWLTDNGVGTTSPCVIFGSATSCSVVGDAQSTIHPGDTLSITAQSSASPPSASASAEFSWTATSP
jgi:hypothetical protein